MCKVTVSNDPTAINQLTQLAHVEHTPDGCVGLKGPEIPAGPTFIVFTV